MLVLLFVILSCGVAKPFEHAERVALNVGENGSNALGPQEAPSESVSYTHLTLPTTPYV